MLSGSQLPELVLHDGGGPTWDPHDAPGAEIEAWSHRDGRVVAYCASRDGRHWVDLPDLARFSFDSGGQQVRVVRHAPVPNDVLVDAYRRSVLPLVLQALGLEVLHSSGVMIPRGVVGVCGDSGAGKSTIAYGLSRRGYALWADDALAVMISDSAISSCPLPFEVRLRPTSASFFGLDATEEGRAQVSDLGKPWTASQPLSALCLLQQATNGNDGLTITRLRPALAFGALLMHAYCFSLKHPGNKRRIVNRYLELAARLPVFEVRFEPRLEALPEILDAIEEMIGGLATAP